MLVKLNDGESVTVMLNHVNEPHAFTISNRGGALTGREFHRPAEQEEFAATDSQQLKAEIRSAVHRFRNCAPVLVPQEIDVLIKRLNELSAV